MPLSARSVGGRVILCHAFGSGRVGALIVGGIHGNEPAGSSLAHALVARLERALPSGTGRTLVIPAVNPDGLAAGQRTNLRGVDINRNFPTSSWGPGGDHGTAPLSEPETRFLAGLIRRYRPACIVQLHQPLGCIDWDGPARDLAASMSRASGLGMKKLGARPGSLGSYAGVEQQIPTVTLELPRSATRLSRDALWQRYGPALLLAVREAAPSRVPTRVRVGGSIEMSASHVRR